MKKSVATVAAAGPNIANAKHHRWHRNRSRCESRQR
jgi:hypothetical protein